jgi:hypothetical protein
VNDVAPALTVLVIVTVSVPASVVIEIPVPAAIVRVSVAESATTELCPATAIVSKVFWPVPELVMVTVSVPASVVIVMPVPATSVSVSVAESATTFDWPATDIVAKLSDANPPPETVAHVLSPLR